MYDIAIIFIPATLLGFTLWKYHLGTTCSYFKLFTRWSPHRWLFSYHYCFKLVRMQCIMPWKKDSEKLAQVNRVSCNLQILLENVAGRFHLSLFRWENIAVALNKWVTRFTLRSSALVPTCSFATVSIQKLFRWLIKIYVGPALVVWGLQRLFLALGELVWSLKWCATGTANEVPQWLKYWVVTHVTSTIYWLK